MRGLIVGVMLLGATSAHAEKVEMSRLDATMAFNAISQIGEYSDSVKQAGQDMVVKRFLKVSPAMRSTLQHDAAILRAIALETVGLNQADEARIDADPQYQTEAAKAAAKSTAQMTVGQQKISVDIDRFTEADLALGDNPQITPLLGSMLIPLMSQATGK